MKRSQPKRTGKKNPILSLAWGGAILIGLLLTLAAVTQTGATLSANQIASIALLRWKVIVVIAFAIVAGLSVGANLVSRFRAERALRESEERFSVAFHLSPHSMLISRRADGLIIDANEAFKHQFGLLNQDVIGKTTVEVGWWPSADERNVLVRRLESEGRVNNYLSERVLPDGHKVITLTSFQPIRLGDEDCIISSGNDITERVNAERSLARSGAELRTIFDHAAIGIALVNADGRPIRCNPALERMLGYRSEELRTMTFAAFTHPADVALDLALFRKLVAGELDSYQIEKRYLHQNGATVWGRLTVSVVRGADGKLAYGVGMLADVSEQKRAELALRESESARQHLQEQLVMAQKLEAVGRLAGGVAHDFNNILASMMLHLDLLKSEAEISPSRQDSLDELIHSSRCAASLTRQLLLFSRREPAQRQVVDLNAIVGNLLKMLARLVGEHLTLVQAGPQEPLWLLADPGRLEQVVMNLVVNARDAMPGGGRIVLRTEAVTVDAAQASRHPAGQVGPFVRLSVIDQGCGMSATILARIYEPFFTTKEAGKGTGLGLATVFGIVQQHTGWIEVESAEGKGSSFSVYLPAHVGSSAARTLEAPAVPVARGSETILVAEDNEALCLAVVKLLRRSGYQVLEAADGRTARAVLDARPGEVDLLLADVVMPGGLMGHEVASGRSEGRRPKVILMSGYTMDVDHTTLDRAGDAYLPKPFDANLLLRTVRKTLGEVSVRN